jgi:hypothetical protein
MNAVLYFHQGFTDIINCLALIDYYFALNKYNNIYIMLRSDALNILSAYLHDKKFISQLLLLSIPPEIGNKLDVKLFIENEVIQKSKYPVDILIHGDYDFIRNDIYNRAFGTKMNSEFFVKAFYSAYDIDYITRIKYFNIVINKINSFCKLN